MKFRTTSKFRLFEKHPSPESGFGAVSVANGTPDEEGSTHLHRIA